MAAMCLRVRVWVAGQGLRIVLAAVVVGIAWGLAMGIAAGARRTESAPDRYTRAAGGDPDLVIAQLAGTPLTAQVAALPGVVSTRSLVFVPSFLVAPTDGTPVLEPNAFAGNDDFIGTRIVDGRFDDPSKPNEFTVNQPMAALLTARFGTHVGDQFNVESYSQAQVSTNFDTLAEPAAAPFTATMVGITESSTEFDDRTPQMVFSPSFLGAHSDVGIVQTRIVTELAAGTDPRAVMDAVHRLSNGGDAFAAPVRVVSDSARRAVRFQATSLWLVTALTVLAAAIVAVQVLSRTLRISDHERRSMLALGWSRANLAIESVVEGVIAIALAVPIAAIVAGALTATFPIGVLRSFEPDPGVRIDWPVTLLGAVIIAAIAIAVGAIVGFRHVDSVAGRDKVGSVAGSVRTPGANMPLSVGAQFASSGARGRRSWVSVLAGAVGVGGLVGAAIVGLNLTHIVDHADRWGVNYDHLLGNPYVPADVDVVTPIAQNPSVTAIAGSTLGSVTINGSDTATIAFHNLEGDLAPTVLHGRDPLTNDEIGLGAEVARRLHVGVGDTVDVVGSSGVSRPLDVVGIVVTTNSAGNGAAMTFDGYRTLSPEATENIALVDFRDGTPTDAIDAVIQANFTPPGTLTTPTSVRALERVTAAPLLLGIVLTILLVVGGGFLLTSSVRARRRDLLILRALGSDSRQLRAIVHWQVTLVAASIMIIGVPLGIILGRWVITLLTNALGIVPGADIPLVLVAAIIVAALAVPNMLALLPAQRATRVPIAQLSLER